MTTTTFTEHAEVPTRIGGLTIKGELVAREDLTIEGTFEGTIEAHGHRLVMGARAPPARSRGASREWEDLPPECVLAALPGPRGRRSPRAGARRFLDHRDRAPRALLVAESKHRRVAARDHLRDDEVEVDPGFRDRPRQPAAEPRRVVALDEQRWNRRGAEPAALGRRRRAL